jgi:hypothetical protein
MSLKYSEITEKIIGCEMKVHWEPGFGFKNIFIRKL